MIPFIACDRKKDVKMNEWEGQVGGFGDKEIGRDFVCLFVCLFINLKIFT